MREMSSFVAIIVVHATEYQSDVLLVHVVRSELVHETDNCAMAIFCKTTTKGTVSCFERLQVTAVPLCLFVHQRVGIRLSLHGQGLFNEIQLPGIGCFFSKQFHPFHSLVAIFTMSRRRSSLF